MRFAPIALAGALAATVSVTFAQDRPLPDYETFAQGVRTHLATDEERQSGYMFLERRTQEKLDGSGHPHDPTVKVFEVYPGLPGEDRYYRLIEEDGHPIAADKLAKEDRSRRQEVEGYSRKVSSESGREKMTRDQEKEKRERAAAIDDLFRIFDMHMVKRVAIEGRDTIEATLVPRPDVKPLTDDGKIMRHFKARAWISESDFELVRAEIEAIDDLSFGLGLLARVHKGTIATYQRRKVNDEIWLPEQVTWTASARVMMVRALRMRGTSDFSGYRKFTVETSTTYSRPPD
jgi:hypothetical protein